MAAKALTGSLQIKVENGTTSTGKLKLKTLSYDINPAAQDADVYTVGSAIANVQTKPLVGIIRVNYYDLVF